LLLTFEDCHRDNTIGEWRELPCASECQDVLFFYYLKSASTKTVIKSRLVKNTHYSGILHQMDLKSAAPRRVYFPVEGRGGRLSAHKRKELMDRRLRQLPLRSADWQPGEPIQRATRWLMCRRANGEARNRKGKESGRGLFSFCRDATLQDFYQPLPTARSPQHPGSPQRAPPSEAHPTPQKASSKLLSCSTFFNVST